MPVFQLPYEPVFPKPSLAEPGGLLAVGGDLRLERLLAAYRRGIFPWYDERSPILWWSPDPRPILFPGLVHVSKRLARTIRSGRFAVTLDTDFAGVIRGCAGTSRTAGDGTWIVPEMMEAYERLHQAGYAHSVEAWQDGELVGGAYGVAIGKAFFGESMFHRVTDASKVAFVTLCRHLAGQGFHFLDCQQTTGHLCRFGAVEVRRGEFLKRLDLARQDAGEPGPWRLSA
ncbi:leucyl/phenylalanyl-tRNA/protein transferase [Solidesulfovibrio carbinoliphilus subsp. oakridgensis]|uniref:Leucyl/phenylalanyl-tRNA--protein transferase n=1 Tax=Solidesulfovibrio carbinoliphilus subsp. oakridgensis TaxID=694327 RepID=G7QE25_9BACT|nr:leucyl/phenylalanyl-tRNA--protein transferase [Solidesulfovibrio carbinoliphilus]EHJ46681.1 leucyl/phenylalanyl-tRNA/protein transferase [Solidesulfovibrio carbinoliphilus subsp. oakridgensis]